MGILAEPLDWVRALALPKGFAVCELGDQWVTCTDPHVLAADAYAQMGCGRYVSIDGNGRATHLADLNAPLPKAVLALGPFDLVTDFGTGEHVFDQAQVWRTLHALTRPGGRIVFDRPAQGYPEHGFYNCHETLYRDLAAANDYAIERLEHRTTPRGLLIRGVLRRNGDAPFKAPQQGRYRKLLRPLAAR